jgi:hypothetical protein
MSDWEDVDAKGLSDSRTMMGPGVRPPWGSARGDEEGEDPTEVAYKTAGSVFKGVLKRVLSDKGSHKKYVRDAPGAPQPFFRTRICSSVDTVPVPSAIILGERRRRVAPGEPWWASIPRKRR